MALIFLLSLALLCVSSVYSATVTYNWNVTWVLANPDGRLVRPVIGINHVWPCPTINVNVGDRLVVHLHNQLGNETTTLHWHGLYQVGTNEMDGVPFATQCPIPPGTSYTYNFTIDQPGTYWYHSHAGAQYPDGLRGPLVVHDPNSPYKGKYDEELVLTFSDWYHEQMPPLLHYYLSPETNEDGAEPVPYSALFNDASHSVLSVQPNKTYLLRIINISAFSQAYIWIDDHDMEIVEVDGIYTEPANVDSIYIAIAQRYSVLIRTKSSSTKNYAITAMMDAMDYDNTPSYLHTNVTAVLLYNETAAKPLEGVPRDYFETIDEFNLVPYDNMPALTGTPEHSFVMNLSFFTQHDQNRAGFNNITYIAQKVPTLYTAVSTGADALNPLVYGVNTNPMVVTHNSLVEIIINNFDSGPHIMHLHGHAPQLVAKVDDVTAYGGVNTTGKPYDPTAEDFPLSPIRRDTWILATSGYTVIRFIANNPGVWFFHCHMEWHVQAGLIGTLIAAPEAIQKAQKIDPAMIDICKAQNILVAGNAAGNTQNYLNLTGDVTVPSSDTYGALTNPPKS